MHGTEVATCCIASQKVKDAKMFEAPEADALQVDYGENWGKQVQAVMEGKSPEDYLVYNRRWVRYG